MRRTYDESYLTRNPRALLARTYTFIIKNRRAVLTGAASALLLLFMVSCLMTAIDSRVSPAVARSTREVKGLAGPRPDPPWINAPSAVLMDAGSGRVIYEKNSHQRLAVASTTKMMTALVARDQLDLDERVEVTPAAALVGEQEIWLEPGEKIKVEDLLYALLVHSANDAALALALDASGSVEAFSDLMNKKASRIGAVDTHFTNPHGLDEPDHYSTAYDLALIGRAVLADPVLAKIVGTKKYEMPWPGHPYPRTCVSHNEVLGSYPGANGIKTGYTERAGKCLVASATRDGTTLISVTLNSERRGQDAVALMDYGFQSTGRVTVVESGERLGATRISAFPRRYVCVVPGGAIDVLSIKGAGDVFRVNISVERRAGGSVKKGTALGRIDCRLGGDLVWRSSALASEDAHGPGPFRAVLAFIWYSICWMGRIVTAPLRIF